MRKLFKCPLCKGEGGGRTIIDSEIGGPWEKCGGCIDGKTGLMFWINAKTEFRFDAIFELLGL